MPELSAEGDAEGEETRDVAGGDVGSGDEVEVEVGEESENPFANIKGIEGLLSEESLNDIMSYIINNSDGVDLSDQEALMSKVSEYLINNLSAKKPF
ncbi:hypothetical protein AYI69_g5043 [Smittium culicis]|uniref:Uncharacterized protein n=1 Tax=Smittium culicis TaxID=133412 RepID=A0A1R1Y8U1_9FUNG|nr:hypothetical protein AYI69_g5043 [Smittium culicis]